MPGLKPSVGKARGSPGRDPPQLWQAERVTALLGIASRLKLARLIQIVPAGSARVPLLAPAGFAGGADIVLLDETQAEANPVAAASMTLVRAAAQETQGLTGYLGRPGREAGRGADVVCLSEDDHDPARARALLGRWTQIGRRCNTAAEIDAALADP